MGTNQDRSTTIVVFKQREARESYHYCCEAAGRCHPKEGEQQRRWVDFFFICQREVRSCVLVVRFVSSHDPYSTYVPIVQQSATDCTDCCTRFASRHLERVSRLQYNIVRYRVLALYLQSCRGNELNVPGTRLPSMAKGVSSACCLTSVQGRCHIELAHAPCTTQQAESG